MYRMKIFAKMVLIAVFGANKNEITEGWMKLH